MTIATPIDLTQEYALAALPMPYILRMPEPVSDEDLECLSLRNKGYRIERNEKGELEIMSPAGLKGGSLELWIGARLFVWAEENGGIAFGPNAGFTLPDGSVRSPDAAWIPQERWDALSQKDKSGYGRLCPDFLIEVLSETDSRRKLDQKMELWMENGARLAWMIDPFAQEAVIHRPGRSIEVVKAPNLVIADAVVTGFGLNLRKVWQSN